METDSIIVKMKEPMNLMVIKEIIRINNKISKETMGETNLTDMDNRLLKAVLPLKEVEMATIQQKKS